MKSVSSLLQFQYKDIYIEDESGRWWNGSLEGVKFSDIYLGKFVLNFEPKLLLSGKWGFNLVAKNNHYNFNGIISYNNAKNYIIERAVIKISMDNINMGNTKSPFGLSAITINLPFFSFNKLGCNQTEGGLLGSLLDKYSLLNQKINIQAIFQCIDKKLHSTFISYPKENLLSGKLVIDKNLDYKLEASSGRILSKIKKLTKLNFTSQPSIKLSGNILEHLN
tara:strand:- start:586 stop:1251 length:666 start_codon:yes stop_codon:yes gene_type:complete